MPSTVSKVSCTCSCCALTSCTPIQSAFMVSAQARKPLSWADRMPFRFKVTSRNPKTLSPQGAMTKPDTPPAPAAGGDALAQEFVQFSMEAGVLRFGDFTTKAGRKSPYFFNTGLFDDGAKLQRLGEFYARRLLASDLQFDMLFGPAYKGITLAAAVAIGLARHG